MALFFFFSSSSSFSSFPSISGGGALIAKDALGDDVTFKGWLDTHPVGDRKLVQGMKGDATYLIVKEDKTLEVTPPCTARVHCTIAAHTARIAKRLVCLASILSCILTKIE